jgi:hypothetical protein
MRTLKVMSCLTGPTVAMHVDDLPFLPIKHNRGIPLSSISHGPNGRANGFVSAGSRASRVPANPAQMGSGFQQRNITIETGVSILRLENGSRWQ